MVVVAVELLTWVGLGVVVGTERVRTVVRALEATELDVTGKDPPGVDVGFVVVAADDVSAPETTCIGPVDVEAADEELVVCDGTGKLDPPGVGLVVDAGLEVDVEETTLSDSAAAGGEVDDDSRVELDTVVVVEYADAGDSTFAVVDD